MKRLLAIVAAACAAGGVQAASSSSSSTAVATTLQPGKPYEACMALGPGDKRQWYFKAAGPVDFALRYRQGDKVQHVMKRTSMRGDGGIFEPRAAHDYCWSWTAAKPTKLEAKISTPGTQSQPPKK
jgi:hypothetical protein